MRIAITGAHGVGKTTLAEDLASKRPGTEIVPEPCWVFSDGAAFIDGPDASEFETQLDQSCTLLLDEGIGPNAVFDRCPLDYLVYLDVLAAMDGDDWTLPGPLMPGIERALRTLDLIVFVPILQPDEIAARIEYPELRRQVDERLRAILVDDDLGLLDDGPHWISASGSRGQRIGAVLNR
jgi:hypothetical protein